MFVSLEGPEGAGKSTVIGAIDQKYREQGRDVLLTREPGDGDFGKSVRQLLLHGDNIDPKTELFLYLADRAEHIARTVTPALAQGKVVLCDRYVDSTIVYQGYARGLDIEFLRNLNQFATGGLMPDKTLLLDLDPKIGLSRLTNADRLDKEPVEFHQKVRVGFLKEAELDPPRWHIVDASQDQQSVLAECLSALGLS